MKRRCVLFNSFIDKAELSPIYLNCMYKDTTSLALLDLLITGVSVLRLTSLL